MTPQEVFDTVANHLRKQGQWARVANPLPSAWRNQSEICAYRTPEGLRCAVGCLIEDEDYDPTMEGKTVDSLVDEFDLPHLYRHQHLLSRLQELHDYDKAWSEDGFKDEPGLLYIADEFCLNYTPPS